MLASFRSPAGRWDEKDTLKLNRRLLLHGFHCTGEPANNAAHLAHGLARYYQQAGYLMRDVGQRHPPSSADKCFGKTTRCPSLNALRVIHSPKEPGRAANLAHEAH